MVLGGYRAILGSFPTCGVSPGRAGGALGVGELRWVGVSGAGVPPKSPVPPP